MAISGVQAFTTFGCLFVALSLASGHGGESDGLESEGYYKLKYRLAALKIKRDKPVMAYPVLSVDDGAELLVHFAIFNPLWLVVFTKALFVVFGIFCVVAFEEYDVRFTFISNHMGTDTI